MKKLIIVALVLMSTMAFATNGYFSHGVGTKHKAMAGAGVALPTSPLSATLNPAANSFLSTRFELNFALFSPSREFTVTGNPSMQPGTFPLTPGTVESDSKYFVVPAFGLNYKVDENTALSFQLYGNGGMNTDYDNNIFYGGKPVGVNLSQLFLGFTASRKLTDNHSLGVTSIFAYQMFEAKGLAAFASMSSDPENLTNNETDGAKGYGVRFGYLGKFFDMICLGASYQSKIWMTEFDKYRGLFAEQGGFDIPSNWTIGLAVKAMDNLHMALDFSQYRYSEIASISNPFANLMQGGMLGLGNGAGFGWEDMNVIKFGANYSLNETMDVQVGYSYGQQPIPEKEVMFNILAPGVVEQHITLGVSKKLNDKKGINVAFMFAPQGSVKGANPMEVPGQQEIELKMMQWDLEVGFTF